LKELFTVEYAVVKPYLPDPIFSKPEDYTKPIVAEEEDKKPALVFLGVDEGSVQSLPEKKDDVEKKDEDKRYHPEGPPYFAIDATSLPTLQEAAVAAGSSTKPIFLELRSGISRLSGPEAGIASEARSLIDWNKRHR